MGFLHKLADACLTTGSGASDTTRTSCSDGVSTQPPATTTLSPSFTAFCVRRTDGVVSR